AAALEHFGDVGIVGSLPRVALDRARVSPLVIVPFVKRRRHCVHRDQARVYARLNVAAMVEVLRDGTAEERNVLRMRLPPPVALTDQDVPAEFRPDFELGADSGDAAIDAAGAQHYRQVE